MNKTKIKIGLLLAALLGSLAFFSAARAETLKIGFVTDWEYKIKKKYGHKFPRKAKSLLWAAIYHYNNVFFPDLVVGGGDYVLSYKTNRKKVRNQLIEINEIFKNTSAPRLYCIGNHDLSSLSKQEVADSLGIGYYHFATDINGLRIITLDTNSLNPGQKKYGVIGRVSESELSWLEEQVSTELPVIVFSHHPLVETPYGKKWRTNIYSANGVRKILEKNGNVVAVFSGHHAINYRTEINGINYVVINNLTDKKAQGAFADITAEIKGSEQEVAVSVSQFGKKPANYNFSKKYP